MSCAQPKQRGNVWPPAPHSPMRSPLSGSGAYRSAADGIGIGLASADACGGGGSGGGGIVAASDLLDDGVGGVRFSALGIARNELSNIVCDVCDATLRDDRTECKIDDETSSAHYYWHWQSILFCSILRSIVDIVESRLVLCSLVVCERCALLESPSRLTNSRISSDSLTVKNNLAVGE